MTSPGPGRPKDMEKRAAILAAAQTLFTAENFAGTSMDAIAKKAGVSKLTVYSHFGDKDNLFREVLRAWMQEYFPESTYRMDPNTDLHDNLKRIAMAHAEMELSPDAIGTLRAIVSDCNKGVPRYGQLVWEEAITRTNHMLEKLLQHIHQQQMLYIDNPQQAAAHFMALCIGRLKFYRMLGCMHCHDSAVLEQSVDSGVSAFIRAYRPQAFRE